MTFNEANVNRETDGKFGTKEGSAPGITLTRAQRIEDLPQRERFEMYPGRETDLDNGDVLTWLEEQNVKTTAIYTGKRYANDGKGPLQHRYSVTFEKEDGQTLDVPFSTGTGWDTAPCAGNVMEALISDAQLYSEGKSTFVSMMKDSGMHGLEADWQWTKLAASTRQFRDFAGDDYDRLVHGG